MSRNTLSLSGARFRTHRHQLSRFVHCPENDIAILTLSKALTLNDPAVGVARVCLPQAGADVTRFATCHVTGWGATSGG